MADETTAKRVILLGSTGSIGLQTLDIVRRYPAQFKIAALSCHGQADVLARQIMEFAPEAAALTDTAVEWPTGLTVRKYHGPEELCRMIGETKADIVLNGIAGSAGLLPSMAALEAGLDLALANKETMVMAGELALEKAAAASRRILPVDSEHSAVFNLLAHRDASEIDEIVLTASGGAFRDWPLEKLSAATLDDALQHPTWNMGQKITVDSASMANKALEVIEACRFFNLPASKVKVVIHPQSCVHALVRTTDGALYAQLSRPDMRLPILGALSYPRLLPSEFGKLDLAGCSLDFRPVDFQRYPLLATGYRAAELGGAYPLAFNAANEIAAAAFLKSEIRFTQIARIVEETLSRDWTRLNRSLDDVILNNKNARDIALQFTIKAR